MEQIKEVLQRNMPVFVIGGITVLIFLFIIFMSQRNPPTDTAELIVVDQEELIATHTYIQGPADAPITIVEFTDFGCPACKSFHPEMKAIVEDYPEYVRWGVRHFPLPSHEGAFEAAVAAQAAGEQDVFWEYADLLYENQGEFKEGDFIRYADFLGINIDQFRQDYNNRAFENIVTEDASFGNRIGINATPTFFMNGKQMQLRNVADLRRQIEEELENQGVSMGQEGVFPTGDTEEQPADPGAADIEAEEQIDPEQQAMEDNPFTYAQNRIEERYGTLEIAFTQEGFSPRNTQAYAGQPVVWTNETEEDLIFEQLMPKFPEFEEPFVIEPGETLEFRIPLREQGLYTYRQQGSYTRASIFINKLPKILEELLPDADE